MSTMQNNQAADLVVSMREIDKGFSGVSVLKHVDFNLKRGEVHAIVGENGAGKSTLMNVLMGALTPEHGEIIINGKCQPRAYSIDHALRVGVTMIPQELALVPALSVAENIMMSHRPKNKLGILNKKEMLRIAQKHVDDLGFHFSVKARIDTLPIAYRQLVCIVKAIAEGTNIIIMDEPTSSLSAEEVTSLHKIIRQIVDKGTSIIYISHYIDEIFAISDRITVMRDGVNVGTFETKSITQRELISMMVGEELLETQNKLLSRVQQANQEEVRQKAPILEVRDLKISPMAEPCSFKAYPGEVLGLAGLVGAGKTEIAKCLFGITKNFGGKIWIRGKEVCIRNPQEAYEHGMAIIPEDRKLEGLCLLSSAEDNISLAPKYRKKMSRMGVLRRKAVRKDVLESIQALSIKVSSPRQRAKRLSGGNQQKLVLAKALLTKPEILLLDEPTRGIDVGAKGIIYELIRNLRDEGLCVIFCSSDVQEIALVCDRTMILRNNKIVAELQAGECTVKNILNYAAGSENHEK